MADFEHELSSPLYTILCEFVDSDGNITDELGMLFPILLLLLGFDSTIFIEDEDLLLFASTLCIDCK